MQTSDQAVLMFSYLAAKMDVQHLSVFNTYIFEYTAFQVKGLQSNRVFFVKFAMSQNVM